MTYIYLQHTQSNYPYVHKIGILKTEVLTTYNLNYLPLVLIKSRKWFYLPDKITLNFVSFSLQFIETIKYNCCISM